MKFPPKYNLTGKTGNLLLVSFFTLTLTALVFLLALYSLDRNNDTIFMQVEKTVQSSARSSDLQTMLVNLELDIRDLFSVILQEPYKLTSAKESLKLQFQEIKKTATQGDANHQQQKLLKQLHWYQTSLDRLLWDYGEVNSVLYEVYFYINNIKEELSYMEEAAGQIMMDLALDGRNTDAVQQAYVLVTIAREKMLQIHILVNSGIANNDPQQLVAGKDNLNAREEETAQGKARSLNSTLRTLTAAEKTIANYAASIQQTIPLLQDNILDLSIKISSLKKHQSLFVIERDNSMKLLADLEENNRGRILSINKLMNRHSQKTKLTAWLISIVILAISFIGLILTRKLAGHLERTAEQALQAREAEESMNVQLQTEVEQRKRIAVDIERARDELEQRVKDRTAELSAANRGLALEIEERKNAEDALASEKEQLAVTLRSIGDGVITTGLDGKVILLNKVAEKLTGWEQKEAYGKSLDDIYHVICESTGIVCENPVDILMRKGRISNSEKDKILIDREGAEQNISDTCAPIRDEKSNIIGVILVFRDISEKKKMQDEVLKSEKLKSVGVLAGGIAHDFNNILAAILGNISLAKLQIEPEKNSKTWKLLEGAEKASVRARNLTQQLLTFSQGGEPVKKVESVVEIIKDSVEFILSGGKVFCQYDIDEDLWPVNIDSGQMSQVVHNIIINAMHAMPDGGKIQIGCSNYTTSNHGTVSLPHGSYVKISIKDQGAGIPEQLLNKIFDPYFTTKEEGSGLGLALTHSIITKHQGHVTVKSGAWGTEFVIFLPAMPDHIPEPEVTIEKTSAGYGKGNILIMDDEDIVRDIARELLAHHGFDVSVAENGQEAIDIFNEKKEQGQPVDVVIMDLTIPGGMGGKEAVQKLLEIDPDVKAIVSSGYSNDPVMAEYKKYGFAGMVHKPFEIEELMDTVVAVIGKGQKTDSPK